uniref:General odorant binding protein 1 n=1 Tax=Grapholita molesta TaxID=192188 RepID=H9XTU5_GRAMO|nr:general odorant binding protein 1 [Grapholita molesta]
MSKNLVRLLLALTAVAVAQATQEVLKDVTLGFGEALEHCRESTGLTTEKMEEFFHFWSDDFKFELREVGCAIQCMSKYFNLLTDGERMHHENTDKFIKSFPNGEVLAKQMVTLIHTCEQQFDDMEDHCWRILRIAGCFKTGCQERGIAPSMELIMAEFIMEADA